MTVAIKIHPKFAIDLAGQQTAVIIPVQEYNGLLEDISDLAVVAERIGEPTISHD